MSNKIVTWGEVINNKCQNISESSKVDIMDKEAEKVASSYISKGIDTDNDDNFEDNNACQSEMSSDSAFSSNDYEGVGVGHSIVCQVSPSQNSLYL